jgi:hypothetical protein
MQKSNIEELLYGKMKAPTKSVKQHTIPTLIENIYNVSKLLHDFESKEFETKADAERWAEKNGIKIVIHHRAGAIVGSNMENVKETRDDHNKLNKDGGFISSHSMWQKMFK